MGVKYLGQGMNGGEYIIAIQEKDWIRITRFIGAVVRDKEGGRDWGEFLRDEDWEMGLSFLDEISSTLVGHDPRVVNGITIITERTFRVKREP